MARNAGAPVYRLTQEEREALHTALFSRLLREVKDGSLTDAQRAMDLMEGDTAALTLEGLLGDNGVLDGA